MSFDSVDELFIQVGHNDSLVGVMADFNGTIYIALTMSCPNTEKFLACTSDQQKCLYRNILKQFIKLYKYKVSICYAFEYNKQGNVHLHGLMRLKIVEHKYIQPTMLDIGKMLHKCHRLFPRFVFHNNDNGVTFQSSFVYLDYIQNQHGYDKWISYMYKDIKK